MLSQNTAHTAYIGLGKRHNYHFDNKPFQDNPPPPAWEKPRDRVVELADGELDRLLNACELMRTKSEHYKDIIQFQIHSAMRMGETLQMTWEQIHINKKEPWKSFIFIPKSHQKTRKHDSTDDRNVNNCWHNLNSISANNRFWLATASKNPRNSICRDRSGSTAF